MQFLTTKRRGSALVLLISDWPARVRPANPAATKYFYRLPAGVQLACSRRKGVLLRPGLFPERVNL